MGWTRDRPSPEARDGVVEGGALQFVVRQCREGEVEEVRHLGARETLGLREVRGVARVEWHRNVPLTCALLGELLVQTKLPRRCSHPHLPPTRRTGQDLGDLAPKSVHVGTQELLKLVKGRAHVIPQHKEQQRLRSSARGRGGEKVARRHCLSGECAHMNCHAVLCEKKRVTPLLHGQRHYSLSHTPRPSSTQRWPTHFAGAPPPFLPSSNVPAAAHTLRIGKDGGWLRRRLATTHSWRPSGVRHRVPRGSPRAPQPVTARTGYTFARSPAACRGGTQRIPINPGKGGCFGRALVMRDTRFTPLPARPFSCAALDSSHGCSSIWKVDQTMYAWRPHRHGHPHHVRGYRCPRNPVPARACNHNTRNTVILNLKWLFCSVFGIWVNVGSEY